MQYVGQSLVSASTTGMWSQVELDVFKYSGQVVQFSEKKKNPWRCNACDQVNRPTDLHCKHCGSPYPKDLRLEDLDV